MATSSGGNHGAHDVVDAGFAPGFEAEDIGPYKPRAIVDSLNRCTVATLTYQRIPEIPNRCSGERVQRFLTHRTPYSPTIATVQRFPNRRGREKVQPTPRTPRRAPNAPIAPNAAAAAENMTTDCATIRTINGRNSTASFWKTDEGTSPPPATSNATGRHSWAGWGRVSARVRAVWRGGLHHRRAGALLADREPPIARQDDR